jgi:exonuclease SbcD
MPKLLHIADVHVGKAFSGFGNKAPLLREAQLTTLRKVMQIGKEQGVSGVLVSGDLFDSNSVGSLLGKVQTIIRESGLNFYILPGAGEKGISGHDALEPGSVYYRDSWNTISNAFIFRKESGEVFFDEVSAIAFYGKPTRYGESPLPTLGKHKEAKYHVALAHGSVKYREEFGDYPIEPNDIPTSGFDYIALGHWHKQYDSSMGKTVAWYPGSPEILESDRTGMGTALLVDFDGNGPAKVKTLEVGKFLWDITDVDVSVDSVTTINSLLTRYPKPELTILKVRLNGTAQPEDVASLKEGITLKLAGFFDLTFDDSGVRQETDVSKYPEETVIGQFVRIMNDKMTVAGDEERKQLAEALRIGVALMSGNMDRKSIGLEDLIQ